MPAAISPAAVALTMLSLRYNFVDHPSVPIFVYARFYCKTLRGRVMRGLGYGSHIERSVASSRLAYPPAPLFLNIRASSALSSLEGGIDARAPRFLASEWVVGSIIDCVMLARDAGA